jgi:DNA mismatch repair ATPase MutS
MSILNELCDSGNAIAFFSTHYKQLSYLGFAGIVHKYMGFVMSKHEPVFTYRLQSGICPSSFAFDVARSAGIPDDILHDAREAAKLFYEYENSHVEIIDSGYECMDLLRSIMASLDTKHNK